MAKLENYTISYMQTVNRYNKLPNFQPLPAIKDMTMSHIMESMDNVRVFQISKELTILLIKTNNKLGLRNLPFDHLFIETRIIVENKTIFGILLSSYVDLTTRKQCFTIYANYKTKGYPQYISAFCGAGIEKSIRDAIKQGVSHEDGMEKEEQITTNQAEKIQFFVCNFLDFLNNPEVELITVERTKEENEKRILRGKNPIPPQTFVHITGKLKIYLNELQSNTDFSYNHRFDVRGHFRTLRSDKWINARGTKIWILPYIKGKGMYIKKIYDVEK